MRYLGLISGSGLLICEASENVRVSYEFDVFSEDRNGITSSGEIRFAATAPDEIFARQNVQLATDDGFFLHLKYSGKKLPLAGDTVHVDIEGELTADFLGLRH